MPVGFPDYYGGLTLPVTVPEGGTGFTAILARALLYGDGSNPMKLTNVGTSGQVLLIDSVTLVPTFEDLSVSAAAITGILAVANGGTGTATPGLVAGAGIGITESWPNQTITNSDDAYFSAGVLAIAHGGTGMATPGLVAGSNIGITGSWPDQTIAVSNTPTFAGLTSTGGIVVAYTTNGRDQFESHDTNVSGHDWLFGSGTGGTGPFGFYDNTSGSLRMTIPATGSITLASPLAVAYGGTGAATLLAAGIPQIVAKVDLTGQTVSIAAT